MKNNQQRANYTFLLDDFIEWAKQFSIDEIFDNDNGNEKIINQFLDQYGEDEEE